MVCVCVECCGCGGLLLGNSIYMVLGSTKCMAPYICTNMTTCIHHTHLPYTPPLFIHTYTTHTSHTHHHFTNTHTPHTHMHTQTPTLYRETVQSLQTTMVEESRGRCQELVLFSDALDHINRIARVLMLDRCGWVGGRVRNVCVSCVHARVCIVGCCIVYEIINTPLPHNPSNTHTHTQTNVPPQHRANMLLVGVGGSGKQSLARLAAYIAGAQVFQVQLTKTYAVGNLLEDIKGLYKMTGVKGHKVRVRGVGVCTWWCWCVYVVVVVCVRGGVGVCVQGYDGVCVCTGD